YFASRCRHRAEDGYTALTPAKFARLLSFAGPRERHAGTKPEVGWRAVLSFPPIEHEVRSRPEQKEDRDRNLPPYLSRVQRYPNPSHDRHPYKHHDGANMPFHTPLH